MLLGLGLLAGFTTTVAGLGGGMMLILLLTLLDGDPVRALAVTTPALLVGNTHRAFLYRRELPTALAVRFGAASLIGALVGGSLVFQLPVWAIQGGMVVATVLAVVQYFVDSDFEVPRSWLIPAGGVVGLASTAGGAGLLSGPVLLAAGLSGGAYLATLSVGAIAMHIGRLTALGAGGAMTSDVWLDAAMLAIAIPFGNVLGRRARSWASERALARVELATCASLVTLAVLGLAR